MTRSITFDTAGMTASGGVDIAPADGQARLVVDFDVPAAGVTDVALGEAIGFAQGYIASGVQESIEEVLSGRAGIASDAVAHSPAAKARLEAVRDALALIY